MPLSIFYPYFSGNSPVPEFRSAPEEKTLDGQIRPHYTPEMSNYGTRFTRAQGESSWQQRKSQVSVGIDTVLVLT